MSPFVDMKRTGWGHCSVRFFDLGFVITNKGAGDKEETGKSNDSDQPHRREKNPGFNDLCLCCLISRESSDVWRVPAAWIQVTVDNSGGHFFAHAMIQNISIATALCKPNVFSEDGRLFVQMAVKSRLWSPGAQQDQQRSTSVQRE